MAEMRSSSVEWAGASKILVEKTNGLDVSDFYIVNLREEYEDSKVGGFVLGRHMPGRLTGVETKFFAIGRSARVIRNKQEEDGDLIHSGAFYYDASSQPSQNKWNPLPARMLIPTRDDPMCVSLGSKIFAFGGVRNSSQCFGEFFDMANESAGWRPIHIPSTSTGPVDISADVISDPVNDRILCTFTRTGCLFAYYPNRPIDDPWVCIHDKDIPAYPSMYASAPIDGVIFYFSNAKRIFAAYDIQTNQTLEVSWSSYKPFGPRELFNYTSEAFLSLGDDVLCLPHSETEVDPATCKCTKLTLVFPRFHARRLPPNGVVFTPLSVNRIPVQGFKNVCNFLPL